MVLNSHATLHRTQLQKQLDDIPTRFERCAQTIRRTSSFGVQARSCSPRRGPVPFNLCRVSRVIAPVPKRQYQTRKGIFANPNEAHEPEKATFPHSPSPPSPDRPTDPFETKDPAPWRGEDDRSGRRVQCSHSPPAQPRLTCTSGSGSLESVAVAASLHREGPPRVGIVICRQTWECADQNESSLKPKYRLLTRTSPKS